MRAEFLDARLKRLCEDKSARQRQRQWRRAAADKLANRLDDLAAAGHMELLRNAPGKWEELTGDRKGQLSCRLDKKLRLVIRPLRQPPPAQPDGGLDWRAVDAVTILEVENFHD